MCAGLAVVGRRAILSCTLKRRKRGIDRLKVCQGAKMRDSMPNYARGASIRGSNWAAVGFQAFKYCSPWSSARELWVLGDLRRLWHGIKSAFGDSIYIVSARNSLTLHCLNLCDQNMSRPSSAFHIIFRHSTVPST